MQLSRGTSSACLPACLLSSGYSALDNELPGLEASLELAAAALLLAARGAHDECAIYRLFSH